MKQNTHFSDENRQTKSLRSAHLAIIINSFRIVLPYNNNKAYDSNTRFIVCVTVMIQNPADGFCADRAHVGSARRRSERRLRSFLRHERMTVRMELAAALHHSSFRGAGPETYDAPRSQMTANSREDSVYFDLYDEDTEGARRKGTSDTPWNRLSTPRPSFRRLMFLCRRWRTNWWRCAGSSMFTFPSRSWKCPRSHLYPVLCRRRVRFAEQTAEQLVEVPTIISYSSLLQRTVDQNVVIPVPDRGGRNLGLQGFSPIQSSTVQLASQKRSSERIMEQIVDSRVLGGGLQDFRPVQGSSASSSSSREHAGEGFF